MKQTIVLMFCALLASSCGKQTTATDFTAFTDPETGCSFRYPKDWKSVTPQAKATLILLYAPAGSQATCNLSAIPADRRTTEDYNEEYFNQVFAKMFKGASLNRLWRVDGITEPHILIDYNFTLGSPTGTIQARSLSAIALKDGKRFMLVCNAPRDEFDQTRPIFEAMIGTLMFSRQNL
jgi:hypothetical protein